ncbi:MAG: lipoate--protein ligase family protein [Cyanobium sp.]
MNSLRLHKLPSCSLPGSLQMAIDVWLLERVLQGQRQGPLLRFYRWSTPTLSLGNHQRQLDPCWLQLAAEGRLALVRRPSGGSAVLHGGDLTYALIWPNPPRRRREAYHLSCLWLQEAFSAMGLPLEFGDSPVRPHQANCFATSTAADLVHPGGQKRIGSAQRWQGHGLLQHGSVAIQPDGALWEEVFGCSAPRLPKLPMSGEALETHLLGFARQWLATVSPQTQGDGEGVGLINDPLRDWEWEAVRDRQGTYDVLGVAGTDSADSAMALATGSSAKPKG